MDATTKKKTLSSALVALLLGSTFIVLATPVAEAQGTTATVDSSGADIAPITVFGETIDPPAKLVASTPNLVFNTTYNLRIAFLDGVTTDSWKLCRPTSTSGDCTITGNPRTGVDVTGQSGKVNVSFPGQRFDAVGPWGVVKAPPADGTACGPMSCTPDVYFLVNATADLRVSLSANTFSVSTTDQDEVTFTVTVTNVTGAAVANAALTDDCPGTLIPDGTTTDEEGKYVFSGSISAVGRCSITASRELGGIASLPELTGSATITISARTLLVRGVSVTVRSGFVENAQWNLTYPNGDGVFGNVGGMLNRSIDWYNLSATQPGGRTIYLNSSGSDTCGSGSLAMGDLDLLVANLSSPSFASDCGFVPAALDWEFVATATRTNGNFDFKPNTSWAPGSYTFRLHVNTAGDDQPEYTTTWNLATVTPAAVNLKLVELGGDEITEFTVPETLAPTTSPMIDAYTVELSIIGSAFDRFPALAPDPENFAADPSKNITVTGDVLPICDTCMMYDSGTGKVTIMEVVPTRVGGNVVFNVDWIHRNTSITVPITRGADNSVDKTEIIVDQTSTLTVTLKDKFGNTVPSGKVYLFRLNDDGSLSAYPGLEGFAINGTGAPSLGQNGQYTFNVRPTAVGELLAYGIIGSVEGLNDNRNFTYARVRVVPAHDLALTTSVNETMASVTTHVFVNATVAGVGIFPLTPPGLLYFLTAAEYADLQANGTSELAGVVQTSTTAANVAQDNSGPLGANLNVTLPPGTWYVYACSHYVVDCTTAKHDNLGTAPTFTVHQWNAAFSPPSIASNPEIQSSTVINVTITDDEGAPANGTLRVRTGGAFLSASPGDVVILDGKGTFTATGVNSLGDVIFEFDPEGGITHSSEVDTAFRVVGPNIVVNPDRVPVGQTTTVTMTVRTLAGGALPGHLIRICGGPIGGADDPPNPLPAAVTSGCTGNATTNEQGIATMGFLPTTSGVLHLYLNGTRTATTIVVFAGLQVDYLPTAPVAGDTVRVTVKQVGAVSGESGVNVTVLRNGTAVSGFPQTTGANGEVVLSNVEAGTYLVQARKAGFDQANRTIVVGNRTAAPPVSEARFELSNLQVPSTATVGERMVVSADLRNTGQADGTASVLLLVNGQVRDTRNIPVRAGGSETVAFDFAPNQAGSFRITVKLATGETLAERTVTVAQQTTTTTGITTPPTPPVTTPAPTDPTPRVPGFEVVALLGALAVALVVLRRRN